MINKFENIAFIALGSNLGDKLKYIMDAVHLINNDDCCEVKKMSSVYLTRPYGNPDQENFLNAVVEAETSYDHLELLNCLKMYEQHLGRIKRLKWSPREIDLDLLFFNDLIYSDETVTIPHPEIMQRDFVLIPLCEIAPRFIHPELKKKICHICIKEEEKSVICKLHEPLKLKEETI